MQQDRGGLTAFSTSRAGKAIDHRLHSHKEARNVKTHARLISGSKVKDEIPKPSSGSNNYLRQESSPGHQFTGHPVTITVGYDALPPLSYTSLEGRVKCPSSVLISGVGAN